MKYKKTAKQSVLFTDCLSPDLNLRREHPAFETLAFFFAMVILTLFPLMIPSDGYVAITKYKFTAFWVISVIFFSLCFLMAFRFLNPRFRKVRLTESPVSVTLPQIFIFSFMLLNIISSLTSAYEDTWLGQNRYEGLCSVLLYGTVFLLMSFWGQFSDKYVTGISIMSALFGFIGLLQCFGSAVIYPDGYDYWDSFFLSTMGNIDCVAGLVSIAVPLLFCAFVLMQKKSRYFCLVGMAFLFFLEIFSDVDSGKLGIAVAFLLTLPFLLETRERTCRTLTASSVLSFVYALYKMFNFDSEGTIRLNFGKSFLLFFLAGAALLSASLLLPKMKFTLSFSARKARRVTALILACLILCGLIFLFFYSGNNRLLHDASEFLHFRLSNKAGSNRGYIWKTSVKLMMEKPILGSGPGTFYYRFDPYILGYNYPDQVDTLTEDQIAYLYSSGSLVHVDFAHNDFLQIGVCVGLLGLLLYLGFIATLAIRSFKTAARSPEVVLLMAGVIGYLVYSFFAFSIAIVSPLFWVLAGLLDHCIRQAPKEEPKPEA